MKSSVFHWRDIPRMPSEEKGETVIRLTVTISLMATNIKATLVTTSSSRDKNQRGIDDRTGRPVIVLSASSGIVVSVNIDWDPSSLLRGGNYIWIYDPLESRYFYYAHLDKVFVRSVRSFQRGIESERLEGQGKCLFKESPTHLHFVVHQSIDGYPKPVNPYRELVRTSRPIHTHFLYLPAHVVFSVRENSQ